MRINQEEYKKRKQSTALDFTIKKDAKGNILNPECVSKTSQSFKDECDINNVIKRGIKNGFLPETFQNQKTPRYGDFTNVPDFQTALNRVNQMKDEFNALPAEVRAKFENDPSKLLEFIINPNNEEEAIKLGILPKPKMDYKRLVTPTGDVVVTYKNGVEIKREPVKTPAPAPGA